MAAKFETRGSKDVFNKLSWSQVDVKIVSQLFLLSGMSRKATCFFLFSLIKRVEGKINF